MSPRYFRPPHGGPGGPPPHLRGGPPPWGRGFRPPFDPNFSPRGMPRRPPMGGPPRGRGYHPPRGRLPGPPRGPPGVMRPRPPFGPRFPHSAPHSPMSTHRGVVMDQHQRPIFITGGTPSPPASLPCTAEFVGRTSTDFYSEGGSFDAAEGGSEVGTPGGSPPGVSEAAEDEEEEVPSPPR
jgi:hypothetical protein